MKRPWRRVLRLSIAVVLLIGYAVAAVWVYRECTVVRVAAADKSVSIETTCAPPTLTSATVLVLLLLVVALLWPDISGIAVLGVSLKRRIEAVQATATSARDSVDSLRDVVHFQQTQLDVVTSSNASSILNLTIGDASGLDDEQKARLQKQAQEVRTDANDPGQASNDSESENSSEAELKVQVLSKFEELSELLGLAVTRGRGRPNLRDAHLHEVQQFFIDDHAGPIRSVRAVRNAVAHARPVSLGELRDALVILSNLVSAAKAHLLDFEDHS